VNASNALARLISRQLIWRAWFTLLATALGLTSNSALAYWEVIPQVDAGFTLEDNPRYIADSATSTAAQELVDNAMGTFIDTGVNVSYQTPANDIRLSPRIRKTDYLKRNKDLNDDTWFIDLFATHDDRRGSIGVAASYRETGVRNSEFENATPENPNAPPTVSGGSGRYTGDDTQNSENVRPFLTYKLSPRNMVDVSFSYADVSYDTPASRADPDDLPVISSYFDYTNQQIVLGMNHYLNDKNYLQLSLNGGSFESEQPNVTYRNSTDSFGVNAAYVLAISPTLSANARVGVNRSSVDIVGLRIDPLTGAFCPEDALCSASDDDRNFVGDIGLRQRSELTTLNFNVSRSVAPSSNGTEVVQDQFRFYVDRTVTQRLSVSAASIYMKESAVAVDAIRDRTYLTIDTTLTWRLTPTLSTYGTYTYYSNEYDARNANTQQTNNRLYVGFSYRGVGFRR